MTTISQFNKISYEEGLLLRAEILSLDENDWKSICTCILKPNNEPMTICKTNVFFNLMAISDNSINKIREYIRHKKSICF